MGRFANDAPGQAVAARFRNGVPRGGLHGDPAGGAVGIDHDAIAGCLRHGLGKADGEGRWG